MFVRKGVHMVEVKRRGRIGSRLLGAGLAVPLFLAGLTVMPAAVPPAGAFTGETITGTVFRDYNADGVQTGTEPGQAGVQVRAVDSANIASPTVLSAANGSYTLNLNGMGPLAGATYRVEFVIPPALAHLKQGQVPDPATVGAVRNGGDVQFAAANATNVSFGVANPSQYCEANPNVAATCFSGIGSAVNRPSLDQFAYNSGTTSIVSNATVALPAPTGLANRDTTGSIGALSNYPPTGAIFAAAFAKRHTGYPAGPDNTAPGKIYVYNPVGGAFTTFYTAAAGNDNHDYVAPIQDVGFWDDVGKTAWGKISVAEDFSTLFAANQFDRKVYAIPVISGSPPVAGVATTMTFPNANTDCGSADWRPGAVVQHDGVLYASITCTAETSQLRADMKGIVYSSIGGANFTTQVATFPLDYARPTMTAGTAADFYPWVNGTTEPVCMNGDPSYTCPPNGPGLPLGGGVGSPVHPPGRLNGPFGQSYYPQPWLTSITFDENNNMVVGISDRASHQFGNVHGTNTGNVEGVAAGDVLKLTPSGANWITPLTDFYVDTRYDITGSIHNETSLGFVGNKLGTGEILNNAWDPAPLDNTAIPKPGGGTWPRGIRSGGIIWLSNTTGARTRSYQIFGQDDPGTFGKAAGIGDVEMLCHMAPIEIGNRVWNDANGNGIQDATEAGIPGVTVHLMLGAVVVGTAVTAADGSYYFGGSGNRNVTGALLPNTAYTVNFDRAADYTGGGALFNKASSPPLLGVNPLINSKATLALPGAPIGPGNFPTIATTTGRAGSNNMDLDAGFLPPGTIGQTIWHDQNANGIYDNGEGLANITVTLTWAGPDGLFGTGDDVVYTQQTDAVGHYLFTGLPPGKYQVVVTILGNAISKLNLANTVDPDGGLDSKSALTLPLAGTDLGQNFAYRRTANDKMYYFSLGGATGPGAGVGKYDQLPLGSPIALIDQQLVISLRNGYVPVIGDTLDIVTGPSITGAYRSVYGNILPSGIVFDVQYTPTKVTLVATKGLLVNSFKDTVDAVPGDGACADASGACTLRAAIMESNASAGRQSIVLAGGGVYPLTIPGAGETAGATGDLDVNKNVTIYGPEATVDAAGLGDRVFQLRNNSNDHLVGLTIKNGNIGGGGVGGVFVNAATAQLDDVTITNNTGFIAGGIGGLDSVVVLNRGVVTGNIAGGGGGGVVAWSSGVSSTFLLDRATVTSNTGTLSGGGLLSYGAGALLTVRDATVSLNSAPQGGGAAAANGGEINLTRGVITGNSASVSGGGIIVGGKFTVNEGVISGNTAPVGAGVTLAVGSISVIDRVTINANTATTSGGALRLEGGVSVTMTTSTISSNTAPVGSAVDWLVGSPVLTLKSVTVTANTTTAGAAMRSAGAGGISLKGSIVADETVGTNCSGVAGGVVSAGFNFSNVVDLVTCGMSGPGDATAASAALGALAYNGGLGLTHKPPLASPVTNTGGVGCPAGDQRGFPRPRGAGCEKGSIEL